jgi:hypothetical protein
MGEGSSVQEYEVEEVSERESEGVTRVGERGAKILCCYRNSNTSTAAGSPATSLHPGKFEAHACFQTHRL